MKKKTLFALAGGTVFTGLMAGVILWSSSNPSEFKPAPEVIFPQKINQSVFLPKGPGVVISYVDYETVGHERLKMRSESFWDETQDSVVETASYYRNGYMKDSKKVFPSDEGVTPIVRRQATYSPGGQFTSHVVNRKDGTCERNGALLASGNYQSRFFYADGKSLKRERVFYPTQSDASGYRLDTEKVLRLNGSVEHEVFRVEASYYKRVFGLEGEKLASFQMNYDTGLNGEIYDKKTRKLLVTFKSNPYESGYSAGYYKAGVLFQTRHSRGYSITDSFYDAEGDKILYQQYWKVTPGTEKKPSETVLYEIHEYNADRQVARILEVEKGKVVRIKSPVDEKLVQVKYLDDNGYLNRTEVKKGREVISVGFAAEGAEKENFDPSWTTRSTPVDIETYSFKDPGSPPWLYDYEDINFKGLI